GTTPSLLLLFYLVWADNGDECSRQYAGTGALKDAIDLFLGNFKIDPNNLPTTLETTVLNFDYHGGAIVGTIFAAAMTILCVLVAENTSATVFWLIIFMALMLFIFFNGEEFVNKPRLKVD
ncbi:unnamed protein product, partial [Gongylonema pulchrum]|uniref:Na_Ca_ex domain-containing protein n=1 Tax=Gongylonema pulchrum TaxID=637853 RepID=A0A183EYI5_9BILA